MFSRCKVGFKRFFKNFICSVIFQEWSIPADKLFKGVSRKIKVRVNLHVMSH
jgi:hypothetical protein